MRKTIPILLLSATLSFSEPAAPGGASSPSEPQGTTRAKFAKSAKPNLDLGFVDNCEQLGFVNNEPGTAQPGEGAIQHSSLSIQHSSPALVTVLLPVAPLPPLC